ncbi:MAG TPA: hypothetical protein DEO97_07970, partial [Pseudomonas sp.]|nr:hypothetical protein [Pseudomonas sp.]
MDQDFGVDRLAGRSTGTTAFTYHRRVLSRASPMPVISNRSRVSLIVALILVGLLLSMYWAGRLAEQRAWAERG